MNVRPNKNRRRAAKPTLAELKKEGEELKDLAQLLRKGFEAEGFICLTHGTHEKYHQSRCDFVKAPGPAMPELTEREHAALLRDQKSWRTVRDGLITIGDELRTVGIKDRDIKIGIHRAIDRIRSYEHSISWGVTCAACAGMLDRLYENDMIAEVVQEREAIAEAVVDVLHPEGRDVVSSRPARDGDGKLIFDAAGYKIYEDYVSHTHTTDSSTFKTFTDTDGGKSIRSMTITEVTDAVLDAIARVAEGPAER